MQKETHKLWASDREYCTKRQAQARECSEKIKNVYQISNELRKWALESNKKNPRNRVAVFSNAELAFVRWYVSIFGDNWRLVANVLEYHPYTRGSLRTKEQIAKQYTLYMREATKVALLANESAPIKPWRTTGLSILVSERPPSLYCSIHPINQMHQICIRNMEHKVQTQKHDRVYKLYADPETGELKLKFCGLKPRDSGKSDQIWSGVSQDAPMTETEENKEAQPVL